MRCRNGKASDTAGRVKHNFGMARPEGYRKAQRLMRLADRFHLPVITLSIRRALIRGRCRSPGQAEAIARSIDVLDLKVPLIAVVIGEGGSGGAIALASGNVTMMLELRFIRFSGRLRSIFGDGALAPGADAEDYRPTLKAGVIDTIVPGTLGRPPNRTAVMSAVGNAIASA